MRFGFALALVVFGLLFSFFSSVYGLETVNCNYLNDGPSRKPEGAIYAIVENEGDYPPKPMKWTLKRPIELSKLPFAIDSDLVFYNNSIFYVDVGSTYMSGTVLMKIKVNGYSESFNPFQESRNLGSLNTNSDLNLIYLNDYNEILAELVWRPYNISKIQFDGNHIAYELSNYADNTHVIEVYDAASARPLALPDSLRAGLVSGTGLWQLLPTVCNKYVLFQEFNTTSNESSIVLYYMATEAMEYLCRKRCFRPTVDITVSSDRTVCTFSWLEAEGGYHVVDSSVQPLNDTHVCIHVLTMPSKALLKIGPTDWHSGGFVHLLNVVVSRPWVMVHVASLSEPISPAFQLRYFSITENIWRDAPQTRSVAPLHMLSARDHSFLYWKEDGSGGRGPMFVIRLADEYGPPWHYLHCRLFDAAAFQNIVSITTFADTVFYWSRDSAIQAPDVARLWRLDLDKDNDDRFDAIDWFPLDGSLTWDSDNDGVPDEIDVFVASGRCVNSTLRSECLSDISILYSVYGCFMFTVIVCSVAYVRVMQKVAKRRIVDEAALRATYMAAVMDYHLNSTLKVPLPNIASDRPFRGASSLPFDHQIHPQLACPPSLLHSQPHPVAANESHAAALPATPASCTCKGVADAASAPSEVSNTHAECPTVASSPAFALPDNLKSDIKFFRSRSGRQVVRRVMETKRPASLSSLRLPRASSSLRGIACATLLERNAPPNVPPCASPTSLSRTGPASRAECVRRTSAAAPLVPPSPSSIRPQLMAAIPEKQVPVAAPSAGAADAPCTTCARVASGPFTLPLSPVREAAESVDVSSGHESRSHSLAGSSTLRTSRTGSTGIEADLELEALETLETRMRQHLERVEWADVWSQLFLLVLALVSVCMAVAPLYSYTVLPLAVRNVFAWTDFFITGVFAADLVSRFILRDRQRHPTILSWVRANWFDFPSLITDVPGFGTVTIGVFRLTFVVRIARIMRLFSLLKLFRILRLYRNLTHHNFFVLLMAYRPFTFLMFTTVAVLAVTAVILKILEQAYQAPFTEYVNSLWFCFVTAGTIGFGDIVPRRTETRFVGMILAMLGIGLLGTLGAKFVEAVFKMGRLQSSLGAYRQKRLLKSQENRMQLEKMLQLFNPLNLCMRDPKTALTDPVVLQDRVWRRWQRDVQLKDKTETEMDQMFNEGQGKFHIVQTNKDGQYRQTRLMYQASLVREGEQLNMTTRIHLLARSYNLHSSNTYDGGMGQLYDGFVRRVAELFSESSDVANGTSLERIFTAHAHINSIWAHPSHEAYLGTDALYTLEEKLDDIFFDFNLHQHKSELPLRDDFMTMLLQHDRLQSAKWALKNLCYQVDVKPAPPSTNPRYTETHNSRWKNLLSRTRMMAAVAMPFRKRPGAPDGAPDDSAPAENSLLARMRAVGMLQRAGAVPSGGLVALSSPSLRRRTLSKGTTDGEAASGQNGASQDQRPSLSPVPGGGVGVSWGRLRARVAPLAPPPDSEPLAAWNADAAHEPEHQLNHHLPPHPNPNLHHPLAAPPAPAPCAAAGEATNVSTTVEPFMGSPSAQEMCSSQLR